MSKTRILVVEDEIMIADNICDILNSIGYEALEPVISFTEAIESLNNNTPDLVILDIQLSGKKDGIDLAWEIRRKYDIPFIFLTSNADKMTVERAKKVAPPAYLVKPFNKDELFTSIEIALYNYSKAEKEKEAPVIIKDALFVKLNKSFRKVRFEDILFVKSEHVYIEIHTASDEKLLVRESLNEYSHKLPDIFLRVHRSYIVNLDHLHSIEGGYLFIQDSEIPIGKKYRDELMKKLDIG